LGHPDYSAALRGTVVGSTYPLYPRNQDWSVASHDARHRHIIFPSDDEQGYYNAAIALLNPGDSEALLDYAPPFPALPTGNADPGNAHLPRPPIWVRITGQGGPFPLVAIPSPGRGPIADYVFRPDGPAAPKVTAEGAAEGPEGKLRPVYPGLWIVPVLG